MRTEEYSKKWERIFENLQYIFQTKFPVVCYASSGTGAMEAAVTNFLSFGDTVAFINAGSFGKRWGNIAQKHGINSIEIPTKFGDITEIEDVKNILDKNLKIKVLFATSEAAPFIKTGGLADVVGALPQYLDKSQFDVRVILPNYTCIPEKYRADFRHRSCFCIRI